MDQRLVFAAARVSELTQLQADYPSIKSSDSDKTGVKIAIDALVDATSLSGPDKTALKTSIGDLIDTDIHVIDEVKDIIIAAIADPETCVQCGGTGKIDGEDDMTLNEADRAAAETGNIDVTCPLCLGETKTDGAYQFVPTNPIDGTYEPI